MKLRQLPCRTGSDPFRPKLQAHIWITDECLAETFNRFLRCRPSHCKRYGSNVPGPLEAKRRLAKRNHTGLAVHADPGAGSSFTATLFGAKSSNYQAWTYEPPGRSQDLPILGEYDGGLEDFDRLELIRSQTMTHFNRPPGSGSAISKRTIYLLMNEKQNSHLNFAKFAIFPNCAKKYGHMG
jgi:hypothetical protein